ncbi:putative methyltransferase PMT17 [Zea mays]|uniref:Methyltransferase n=1 Tax=Zea mays TaxID=4577 RepID=A0A3L6EET1_MAIZE|nr:putative methyltransferase PMT17 [Zea mays]
MAKEQDGSPKVRHPEFQRMRVTLTIGVIGLCVTAYILGAWQGTSNGISSPLISTRTQCKDPVRSSGARLDFQAHHQVGFNESALAVEKFPPCQLKYSEYTPCQDPRKARKFPKKMMQYRERHCPKKEDMLRCLIPAPPNYSNPFQWPKSRDYAWFNNIPHRELSIEKAVQNWIHVEGDLLRFPGGGTMFPHGADAYIDDINALVPLNEGNIRTALDTGCGKSINHVECVDSRKVYDAPQICKSNDVDSAWYKKMDTCISPLPDVKSEDEVAGGVLETWPKRAFAVPPRVIRGSVPGLTPEKFQEDNKVWSERVDHYKKLIPPLGKRRYRNVMDMNAGIGGFAAALMKYPLWVMNVVPSGLAHDTLGVIYERGFIGTYHDWCEAFSTYPRTYDLIHADKVFSSYQDRCDITYILLEMDRILRPEGTVIIRDNVEVLVKVQAITGGMRWKSQIMDHESGPFNPDKILVAVKTYWTGKLVQKQ